MRLTLARYGFPPSGESAFLCLDPGVEGEGRFIRLLSVKDPFDCCEGVSKGDKEVRLVSKVDLSLVIIGADGARHEFNSVAPPLARSSPYPTWPPRSVMAITITNRQAEDI